MNRMDLLLKVFDSTFDKESWYAPFKDSIDGLTAEQARWKPAGEAAKSIWENLNHLIYYKERLVANLEGREWTNHLSGDENFYLTEQSNDDQEWMKVVERAVNVNQKLREILSNMTVNELDHQSLDGKLLDIFVHDAYHTGQIMQTRKMQGSWPSNR
ncbi:DinB family protein [Fictibacillus barbaricus]|uniref:Damage-inducible protein DinB n=1 Tax=Fictibacillus barbaricus TaxID=182136 RepID=A0ABU1TWT9_9BACL|nr:DinB family protein [Fictibacillus barbaricus]MDR7071646.1 putative damage-inducible protein DinB [Fictibacillus barbaricus]